VKLFSTAASITGEYGSLIINSAGNWSYAASNSQSVIQNLSSTTYLLDFFTIRSADNTTHSVIIGIKGADETNTADAITLSWNAPSEREDNTAIALSEIAGFKIYAGTTQGQYLGSITINDGSATNYTFEGVTTGTYYFAMTTLDTDGRESQHSAEIQINH
jgi:VCBS repeat-containing protein